MKLKVSILVLYLFPFIMYGQKCDCQGLVDLERDVKIIVFDEPNGQPFDTLSHNIQAEDFLTFKLLENRENHFKVDIGLTTQSNSIVGWVKKEGYLGTYARNYSEEKLKLYSSPDKSSPVNFTINEYFPNLYELLDCDGNWVRVKLIVDGQISFGWLSPSMQCPNPYTTCN